MRASRVLHATVAAAVVFLAASCSPRVMVSEPGPGCLIHIYTLPNLQGYGLPIVRDTPELAAAWHDRAASARVIYGTWRLFADIDYKGFMGDYKAPSEVLQLIPSYELDSLKCIAPEPPPVPRY
jgi:hypothetical protein